MKIKCRLARYWYRNHPNVDIGRCKEWRNATIKRVDKHSGQVQLVVRIAQKDYLWWCHLDSFDEVKPIYSTQVDNSNDFVDSLEQYIQTDLDDADNNSIIPDGFRLNMI